jgi:predicted kinase
MCGRRVAVNTARPAEADDSSVNRNPDLPADESLADGPVCHVTRPDPKSGRPSWSDVDNVSTPRRIPGSRGAVTEDVKVTRLLITRGLPASGKTTFARKLQPRVVRVNRDDLRLMLHGRRLFTQTAEGQVSAVQRASVEALLRAKADVIVDDTNLRTRTVREWAEMAARFDATFEVHDFTDVPLDECLRRDADRPEAERVGAGNIRRMHDRYLAGKNLPLPVPWVETGGPGAVYDPPAELPPAVLVDIDGTVALMNGRDPYDMERVGEDTPNDAVIAAVRAMHAAGNAVIYCTGRNEWCRAETEAWLDLYVGVPYEGLFMRADGDSRRDADVKRELFDDEIRDRWRIMGVFDDRRHVVRMWRSLGLTVFHVAEGDY